MYSWFSMPRASSRLGRHRGSAAALCGEAWPHRKRLNTKKEAPPRPVEAQPRRELNRAAPERQSLSAQRGGEAAKPDLLVTPSRLSNAKRGSKTLSLCAARRIPKEQFAIFNLQFSICNLSEPRLIAAFCLLLSAVCLLLTAYVPSLTAGVLTPALAQSETAQPSSPPASNPAPTSSASPTPPANLHQWGAVTLFHGLPSDRVHAIAQDRDGVMWFATDGGLARYDGRRTQAVSADGLPQGRVLALKLDDQGTLWIGTDSGAAWLANGKFRSLKETEGKVITAIITPERGRAFMASENGLIFDCRVKETGPSTFGITEAERTPAVSFAVHSIPDQPLQSADRDHPGPLKITSLGFVHEVLYAGTQSRGLLAIENGQVKEVQSKPRTYFINALETDARERLWAGGRARGEESGLSEQGDPLKPAKVNLPTGPVTAITRGDDEDIWVASDGRGAFHLANGKEEERFTFQGTGGALRSDHVFAIFVDREEVVWFGTDKGVCRYDPRALRTENISDDPNANYVRALLASNEHLFAGSNSGLFVYSNEGKTWQPIPELARRIVYTIGPDAGGRALIGTASGLFSARESPEMSTRIRSGGQSASFVRIPASSGEEPQGDSVRAIANVNGETYIATYGYGIERVQGPQRALVWPDAGADGHLREVTCLGRDSSDHLVIGTASGDVFFFDGHQAIIDGALENLKGGTIWSVLADGSALWLATGKGLYLFQSGQLKEIVAGVNARQLAAGAGNDRAKEVWCATVGNGVYQVILDDQFGAIVSHMDIEQGLPSQRTFAILAERAKDGGENVIIGTGRGIARYEPGRMPPMLAPERIISKRIHSADELSVGLQLDYPQNSLLLDVTANSSRTFPEQFQYAFALYDAAGHVIRQKLSHDAQFPMEGLRPGKYKVVARAFTKDLVASDPLSFQFNVAGAPFPWTTTALAVLLALALIALGWGYLQNRRIHRASAELASTNRELADARLQLANETEAERRRIARDLHDQTLADLRNLLLLVDALPHSRAITSTLNSLPDVRTSAPPYDPGELRAEIESISQEVRRICEDLSPSALENVGLSAALQFALSHAVEHAPPDCQFEYEFNCDDSVDEEVKLPPSAQIQVYRIAQEALSNICRHAHAKYVKMSARVVDSGAFELKIEDDGCGFDLGETKKNSGRGVANIRARAGLIDAEVSWTKRDGGGTVFTLRKGRQNRLR